MNDAKEQKDFGVNIWWTVPGIVIPVDTAQMLLEKHGFEKTDMKEPSDRMEVSRAVNSFQDRRHKNGRRLAEIADEGKDHVVYGILDREQPDSESVSFIQGTTVTYNKNAGGVKIEGTLAGEVEKALDVYRDKLTDQDVRYFLRRLVKACKGVAKRPSGGIYFVPSRYVGVIEQAQQFLAELAKELGLDCRAARLYVERVVDGEAERKIVWEAVEADIDDQLETILNGVDRVEKRVSALKNHEAQVEELRELMKIYQDLLGKEAEYEEVTGKLDAAVQTIAGKMSAIQNLMTSGVAVDGVASADEFEVAVATVLKAEAGPLSIPEVVSRIKASGFAGKFPKRVDGFFNNRVKNGKIARVGRGKFTLIAA